MLIIFEIVVLKSFIGVVLKKCRTMLSRRLESKGWNESENQNLKTRNLQPLGIPTPVMKKTLVRVTLG